MMIASLRTILWLLQIFFFLFILSGCCTNETYAPVVNAWNDSTAMKSKYRVQKDDTIYSIAWSFDLDYRDLANANHLFPPYTLKPGQTLTMQVSPSPAVTEKISPDNGPAVSTFAINDKSSLQQNLYQDITPQTPVIKSEKSTKNPRQTAQCQVAELTPPCEIILPELELHSIDCKCPENIVELPRKTVDLNQDRMVGQVNSGHWQWPARGKLLKEFSLEPGGSKGIDIGGTLGDPVRSVAPGKVVYSGSGLRGYGNLVIIKHSDNYLSAYAYNRKLLVKEGDVVKAGAEIGKMGQNSAGNTLLHFEIRRNGKPVNPLLYL